MLRLCFAPRSMTEHPPCAAVTLRVSPCAESQGPCLLDTATMRSMTAAPLCVIGHPARSRRVHHTISATVLRVAQHASPSMGYDVRRRLLWLLLRARRHFHCGHSFLPGRRVLCRDASCFCACALENGTADKGFLPAHATRQNGIRDNCCNRRKSCHNAICGQPARLFGTMDR